MPSSRFFTFPNPVNEVAARTVAIGVSVMTITAIASGATWLTIPLAYGFLARVLAGPRISPLGLFATRVVSPRLGRNARLVAGPPKRFAQTIGLVFSLTALALWLAGERAGADVALGVLALGAVLEASIALCLGCEIFTRLMRAGVIPEEVCLDCAEHACTWTPPWHDEGLATTSSNPS